MSRLLLSAIVIAALAQPAIAAAAPPRALVKAVQSQREAAYRGELIVATWDSSGTHVTLVTVEHDPPDWTRLDYQPLGSSRRWTVLRRGLVEIQFDPHTRTGTRTTRMAMDDEAFFTSHLPWLLENYDLSVMAGTLLGRNVERLVLTPRIADRPTRRIDIDAESGAILRSERVAVDGRLGELTAFVSFEFKPRGWRAAASPGNLRLTPQPGARIVTIHDAGRLLGARPVEIIPPQGFHRSADYLTDERGPVLHTLYTDGLSIFVVSQHRGKIARPAQDGRLVTVRGGPVWIQSMGLRTLAHWAQDGWVLTAVGDVTPQSLLRTAEATGVAPAPRLLDRIMAWVKSLTSLF